MKKLVMAFIAAGGLLMMLASTNILPAAWFANLLSTGDQISDAFRSILHRQQFSLGISLLIGASLIWVLSRPALLRSMKIVPPAVFTWAPVVIAAASGAACLLLQHFLFENIPHVTDATCHYFQGKIFAGGRLTADAPPCPDAFYQHNMIITRDGHWFSRYPPGTALLIAIGLKVDASWLIFPLVQFLSVLAFHSLARRFFSPAMSGIATALYAFSPMILLLGSSFMSHTPFMALALAGMSLFLAPVKDDDPETKPVLAWFSAGLLLGATVLFRPQDTFIVGLLTLICICWAGKDGWSFLKSRVAWTIAGGIIPLGLFAAYNHLVYGSAWSTGYGFGHESALHPGIAVSLGFHEHFTLMDAVRNTLNVGYKFNYALFGWPVSLLFALFAFFNRQDRRHWLACIFCILFVTGFFFFYSYPAYEYEARFWILLVPFCVIMSAAGFNYLFLASRFRFAAGGLLAAFVTYSVVDYWPRYIWPTYAQRYEEATRAYVEAATSFAREHEGSGCIFLIDPVEGNDFNFSSGFIFNDPGLTNQIIFARHLAGRTDCLTDAFPDRTPVIMRAAADPFTITLSPLPD